MTVSNDIQTINPGTLKQWLQEKRVLLIDVREPGEYKNEHIPGALSVPLSKLQPEQIPTAVNQTIVLSCQSGKRSNMAAQKLVEAGLPNFLQLEGGLNAWKEAGYETEASSNAPISLMRQVRIVAGTLVFTGTVLGAFVSPWFLILSGFVGAGLIFAGITDTCAMAMLLAKLPYNQK